MVFDDLLVYFVDDDEEDLEIFQEAVTSGNNKVRVHTINNSSQVLNALQTSPRPNIMFLDLNMPGKNGFDVLREVRGVDTYKDLPIVILSTSSDNFSIAMSRKLGANYYLTKSTDYRQLQQTLFHALAIDWRNFSPDEHNFVYKN